MTTSGTTPLIALEAAVLDCGTTGLDPAKARLIEIAAVALDGERIAVQPLFASLVGPGVQIPVEATAVHGLDAQALAGAPGAAVALERCIEAVAGRVVIGHSTEVASLTRRVAEFSQAQLAADGSGPPPRPYAVVVLGSVGRDESLLAMDQDNALVFADGPKPDDAVDAWYAAFSQALANMLHAVGVPFCKGGVMATKGPGVARARPGGRGSPIGCGTRGQKISSTSTSSSICGPSTASRHWPSTCASTFSPRRHRPPASSSSWPRRGRPVAVRPLWRLARGRGAHRSRAGRSLQGGDDRPLPRHPPRHHRPRHR